MSRPGFVPTNHPNQIEARALAEGPPEQLELVVGRAGHPRGKRGVDDMIDDRETPPCVWVPLDAEFRFTLDAAASVTNHKCPRYCTLGGYYIGKQLIREAGGDGLTLPWSAERVWCNPPYSGLRPWVERAWDENAAEAVVLLLPNNRSEQPFWQRLIEPYRDRPGSIVTTRHLPKRRPFLYRGDAIGNSTSKNPPFGLVVVVWDRRVPEHREPVTKRRGSPAPIALPPSGAAGTDGGAP
jgi:hypothetical protein